MMKVPNRVCTGVTAFALTATLGLSAAWTAPAEPASAGKLPYELRTKLQDALNKWVQEQTKEKNADGVENKRGTYSRLFREAGEDAYYGSAHIDVAETDQQITTRYRLKLQKTNGKWQVVEAEPRDTFDRLYRVSGSRCYPFERFDFDREGMKASASNGSVCESYLRGEVTVFGVWGPDMRYEYAPPAHAEELHIGHGTQALSRIMMEDHQLELVFDPKVFLFGCDPATCEELLSSSFTGLNRDSGDQTAPPSIGDVESSGAPEVGWARQLSDIYQKQRKENPFAHFRQLDPPGHRYFEMEVLRNIAESPSGVALEVDNWGGYEVQFHVSPPRSDTPETMRGTIWGYYTKETLASSTPYEIERRDDGDALWHEVYKLTGDVDMALEDPEILKGNVTFGITLKRDLQELPFFIASIPTQAAGGGDRPPTLFVNSIQLDGEELTWARTGQISGLVVLPEPMPAGSKLELTMDFATRAILKRNHAYSAMNRFGWMPFVRFGDFIDEFKMTIRSPAQYEILGVGHKVSEKVEDGVLVSHWRADSPVVFPTIIFGKYTSDDTGDYEATKLDGTVIPVEVHVDEVSMRQLDISIETARNFNNTVEAFNSGARGIRGKALRPIATQAAVAINLYKEISGLDYPYGELNLVNDPAPALYGQAPSSLIYLGSFVFRGEGTMAGDTTFGGGGTSTAKFLKSVTAHEVGHQWWGSRVSNANFRNYWFVESLAEYFSALYLEAAFGRKDYDEQVDEWRQVILNRRGKTSVQNASSLWPGEDGGASYQAAVYNRGPYAFHMLRETFGDEKFFPFLKQFSQELAEKREIVSLDIQEASEKALGGVDEDGNAFRTDLGWFFDQWIRGVGIPQYKLDYDIRQTEDGGWLIEGKVTQRVLVGSSRQSDVLEGTHYRGVVDVTVQTKDQEYSQRIVIDAPETPIRLKVPAKPVLDGVRVNANGAMLAHDTVVNKAW